MDLIFRTFKDGDASGILKNYFAAFCKLRICQPSTPEFWEWKYGPTRPNYAPEGYQICEYKGKIVGTIMSTLRTMKFNGEVYKVAGIDDVATCPLLEKRGIGKRLMENAIKFMEEQDVDLSILAADPRGHAKKIYWRIGYKYTTFLSTGAKALSIRNAIANFTPGTPLAIPLRLYGCYKTRRRMKKYKGNLKFEILGKNQDEFRNKLNENYQSLYSFNEFDQKYWNWYYVERPELYESVVVAAKENGKIIAGGVITKEPLMGFNTKRWWPLYLLTELFVDKAYRGRGIGSYVLGQLERIAKQRGVGVMLAHFHGRHEAFRTLVKRMGYIYVNKTGLLMMKPISARAKELFEKRQEKKYVWKVPWEQMGY